MKTAMQLLFEEFEALSKSLRDSGDEKPANLIDFLCERKEVALEKEKEVIKKAFADGQEMLLNNSITPMYSNEEYYNDNYNQEEIIVVDFDKVKEEWIKEADGMTDLEKANYYHQKILNQNK